MLNAPGWGRGHDPLVVPLSLMFHYSRDLFHMGAARESARSEFVSKLFRIFFGSTKHRPRSSTDRFGWFRNSRPPSSA